MRIARHPRLHVFGVIVLAHALLILALLTGRFNAATLQKPHEVFATLIPAQLPVAVIKTPTHQQKRLIDKAIHIEHLSVSPIAIESSDIVELPAPNPDTSAIDAPPVIQEPTPPSQPKTIATGVEYIRPPAPVYPPQARRLREQGKAVLRVFVNTRGLPESAEIDQSSGYGRLDEAARQAVLRALFRPFMENGVPKAVYAMVPIRFQLDG